jgi:hypothetical protein
VQSCGPLRSPCLKTQEQIHQQRRPELPAYGLLGVAEEVADLQGLLDLFEENLDGAAALIESADAGGVDTVNGLFETAGQTLVTSRRAKARKLVLVGFSHWLLGSEAAQSQSLLNFLAHPYGMTVFLFYKLGGV